MKGTAFTTAILVLCSSCAYQRVGTLTMLSTRNVDSSKGYELLRKGVEGRAKSSNNDALQVAVDNAVATLPGGEYMMNVQVMVHGDGDRVKVVGDVWGMPVTDGVASPVQTGSVAMKVGDRVAWKSGSAMKQGTIIGLRNDIAVVQEEEKDGGKRLRDVKLDKLTKLQ